MGIFMAQVSMGDSGSSKNYLVEGAKLACTNGEKAAPVKCGGHNFDICGKALLNEDDFKPAENIPSFGKCEKTGKPCVPVTTAPWMNVHQDTQVDGKGAVSVDSCLLCSEGGLIIPEESGQADVMAMMHEKLNPEDFATAMGYLNAMKNGSCLGGDPVNLCTGNFIYQKKDIEVGGNYPLNLMRSYNSVDLQSGVLGSRWRHNHEVLLKDKKDLITVTFGDGHIEIFHSENNHYYVEVGNKQGVIVKRQDGYEFKKDSSAYTFDKFGRCLKILDRYETAFEYEYEGEFLSKISNLSGSFNFSYDENNRLTMVEDHTGRVVKYKYNECDQLIAVVNPLGHITKYAYDNDGNLSEEIDPKENAKFKNRYDRMNRVTDQEMSNGAQMVFEYRDNEKKTIYTEPNGNRIRIYYDDNFRTTKIVSNNSAEFFEYDGAGHRTTYRDRNGNEMLFEYVDNNLARIVDPLGNETKLSYTKTGLVSNVRGKYGNICREFDHKNRLISITDQLGQITVFNYSSGIQPDSIKYPDGSMTRFIYDGKGNPQRIRRNTGETNTYTYDNLNRKTSYTDSNGNVTRYEYDAGNRLIHLINANGDEQKYDYDENGRIVRFVDFDGFEIIQEFDSIGQCVRKTDKEGRITHMEYDVTGNRISLIYPNRGVYTRKYNKKNNLSIETDPQGKAIEYTYDANDNCIKIKKSTGEIIEYTYDALGRKISEVLPGGQEIRYDYNAYNQLVRMKTAAGDTLKYKYDAAGHVTKIIDEHDRETCFTYNPLGQVSEIKGSDSRKIVHEYESGGRLKKSIFRDGSSITCEYDVNGNMIKQKTDGGFTLEYSYDCLNRVTKVWDSNGNSKAFTLDSVGNVLKVTNALGDSYCYKYSPNGNLMETIDPSGNGTFYSYDEMNNLVSASQCSAQEMNNYVFNEMSQALNAKVIAQYERNIFGQVVSYTDALGNIEEYHYDDCSRVDLKTDRDGYKTSFAYDLSGNLTDILYDDGKSVKKEYDSRNRLKKMTDWLGTTQYEYDDYDRLKTVTDHNGRCISYVWDNANLLESLTYPDGAEVTYRYDENGKILQILDGENTVDYQYGEAGYLLKKTFSNGASSQYTYNENGQVQSILSCDKNFQSDQCRYEYDALGNKVSIYRDIRGEIRDFKAFSYEYDAMNRLTGVKEGHNYLRQYEYDGFGNRTVLKENGNVVQYTYNEENQLILETEGENRKEFTYDKRGNCIHETINGKTEKTYHYGAQNCLSYAERGNERVTYNYNGFLQQVSKTKSRRSQSFYEEQMTDIVTEFILDPLKEHHNLLMKETNNGQEKQRFVWDRQRDTPVIGTHIAENRNTAFPMFYMNDELGSTMRITDGHGYTRCNYSYDEFGRESSSNKSNIYNQPLRYTGHDFDEDLGLYHTYHRYYETNAGRFVGEDLEPGNRFHTLSLNRYTYCLNNPLILVDPDGLKPGFTREGGREAHDKLQDTFVMQPTPSSVSRNKEFPVENYPHSPTHNGKADIVVIDSREKTVDVYELKPASHLNESHHDTLDLTGQQQLEGYISKIETMKQFQDSDGKLDYRVDKGTSFNPTNSTLYKFPSTVNPGWDIIYFTVQGDPGMIYYDYRKSESEEQPQEAYAFEAEREKQENLETAGSVVVGGVLVFLGYKFVKTAIGFAFGGPVGAAIGACS